jgi:hypothetical protein
VSPPATAPPGSTPSACRRGQEPRRELTAAREPAVIYLPGREAAHARRARHQARALLAAWGLGEHASLGELIVGELVANAVCHGRGPVWMRVSAHGGGLRVEVHDDGAGRPVRRHADGDDERGRGLELLDGLIELHGGERGVISDQAGPGKTVYVVLSLQATLAGAAASPSGMG